MFRFRVLTVMLLLSFLSVPQTHAQESPSTIKLDGKGKVLVFLLAGQSNMDGRGVMADLDEPTKKRVRENEGIGYWWHLMPGLPQFEVQGDGWQTLTTYQDKWNRETFGPEITFGRTIHEKLTGKNTRIAIIKLSEGGSDLHEDWCPELTEAETKGTHLYPWLLRESNQAIGALNQMGYETEVAGFVWVQGWSDAFVEERAKVYEANLTKLFHYIRRDYGTDLPIIYNKIHPEIGCKWTADVAAGQEAVAKTISNAGMITVDDLALLKDKAHYKTTAYLTMGERLAEKWLEIKAKQAINKADK
ncbi:sialate O-acetylesterase [Poriferisphaera sp. WC338]|uniref:sialate O-acetylesterase n=1 Tax=Poriferisphaera sp. WC338 TaxID=3425129 RepID=UPI003D812DF2